MSRAAGVVIVVGVTLLLQTVIVDSLPVFGVRLDLFIVVTVAAGLGAGPDRGAAIGFLCGLVFDLTQDGPLGLGALIYSVSGYLVGSVARSVVGSSRLVPTLAAGATSLAAVTSYVLLGVVLGETGWLTTRMITVVLVVSAGATVLTPAIVRIMAWTDGASPGLPRPGGRFGSRGAIRANDAGASTIGGVLLIVETASVTP